METYKIALASDWYYPKTGGVETHIHNLAKNLVRKGHEVEIITHKYPYTGAQFHDNSILCHRLGGAVFRRYNVTTDLRVISKLQKVLKEGNYDIIHGHGITSPISLLSCLIGKKSCRAPAVITNHSLLRKVRPNFLVRGILRPVVSLVDAVIAVSTAVESETKKIWKGPVFVIPNGIDMNNQKKVYPRRRVVTTVSRLVKKKNVIDLVRIAPSLIEHYPDIEFKIVGDGPERTRIQREVRAMGIERHFNLIGMVPHREVEKHLMDSAAFVLPSSDEAFGISILEAMACGVPVVAKNHSGVSDIIIHGQNGFLADNVGDLERFLEELLKDSDRRNRIVKNGLQTACRFKWERITEMVLEVYKGVIN